MTSREPPVPAHDKQQQTAAQQLQTAVHTLQVFLKLGSSLSACAPAHSAMSCHSCASAGAWLTSYIPIVPATCQHSTAHTPQHTLYYQHVLWQAALHSPAGAPQTAAAGCSDAHQRHVVDDCRREPDGHSDQVDVRDGLVQVCRQQRQQPSRIQCLNAEQDAHEEHEPTCGAGR